MSSFNAARTLLAVVLLAVPLASAQYSHTIYVDPERGTNSTACLDSPSPSLPCRNLSYAFHYRNNSTQYVLQRSTHYLNNIVSDSPFTDLQDIAITGNGSVGEVEVACFTSNAGLTFIRVLQPLLRNVTFSNCAALRNSTSRNYSSPAGEFKLSLTKVALYFNDCENVVMEYVHVVDSPGASGVTIYNTVGANNFTQCNFSGNSNSDDPYAYPGGGGFYVEFSYCLPGDSSCANATKDSYTDNNKDSSYLFTECTFAYNKAFNGASGATTPTSIIPYRQNHVAFGRGGGLSVFFNGNSSCNHFNIISCNFTGNEAKWGGGMFAAFHDTSGGNSVLIDASRFEYNKCEEVAGGGMRIDHYVYGEGVVENEGNRVEIRDSTKFSHNTADAGGGLSISPARQNSKHPQLFSVSIERTFFENNRATTNGAALNVDLFSLIVKGCKPHITLTNCTFLSNTVYPSKYTGPHEVGIGAVYINQVDVHFRGDELFFYNNSGSALALVTTSADFMNCSAGFFLNAGINGGAISLLGSSTIVINQSTELTFTSNSANEGGAIYNRYIDPNNYQESPHCFITHYDPFLDPDDWGANFRFYSNLDSGGENAIYSTSILPCSVAGGKGEASIKRILCWNNWTYDSSKNCSDFIHTGPGNITRERVVPYSPLGASADNKSIFIPAYAGQFVPLFLHAVDDLGHLLPVVYTATLTNNYTSLTNYSGVTLDPNNTYVSHDTLRVFKNRENGTNITVYLDAVGDRPWQIEVNIELQDCPPGLLPTRIFCGSDYTTKACISCECVEFANYYNEIVRCNTPSNASLTSGYWMGSLSGEVCYHETCMVAAHCPPGFCRAEKAEFIALPPSGLNEHICGPQKRKGELCGKCIEGYGPALNSDTYDCVSCNVSRQQLALHATYYVLAVYVPLFLLFLAIIVFNIKLTTGPANAFILYSQVISSTFDINAAGKIPLSSVIPNIRDYLTAYKFPYGTFNLEFFETFVPSERLCLGTGLNVLDIMLLDYIVAAFPLLMILAVVLFYKTKNCCCKRAYRNLEEPRYIGRMKLCRVKIGRIGDALLPAFASFILLSYTKFSLTSSYISVSRPLYDAEGHVRGSDRVYFAGHYSVNDQKYVLFYRIPAILIFLTFVTIPPLLLLNYPLWFFEKRIVQNISWLRRHYPQVKIHIMLDAFQGCYKNKWRCFAGLYFVFRLLINVTYIFANTLLQFTLQGMYCMVYSLLIAYLKPYKKEFHLFNYVDSIMFLNLGIINQISFYQYAYTRNGTAPSVSGFIVQYILVFLPLIYMVSYVVWAILPIPNARARVKEWLANRQQPQQLENLIQNGNPATPEPTDNIDWERAQEVNCYSPTTHTAGGCDASNSSKGDSGLSSKSSEGRASRQTYGSTGGSTTVSFNTSVPEDDD